MLFIIRQIRATLMILIELMIRFVYAADVAATICCAHVFADTLISRKYAIYAAIDMPLRCRRYFRRRDASAARRHYDTRYADADAGALMPQRLLLDVIDAAADTSPFSLFQCEPRC